MKDRDKHYKLKEVLIGVRKWCRSQQIFGYFYKFICKVYVALLIYEHNFKFLPKLVKKVMSEVDVIPQ